MQLHGLDNRFPRQLSGGQRQRVALARALAVEPRVLLLDEPFGALDARVRKDLRDWLRALHDRLAITTIFVTHDQEEALGLADRIAILNKGRIEQIGRPAEVYDNPASPFVCEFLGPVNRCHGDVRGGVLRLLTGDSVPQQSGMPDGPATVYIRPHDVLIENPVDGRQATVRTISVAGPRARLLLDAGPQTIEAEVDRAELTALRLMPGSAVTTRFRRAWAFPSGEGSIHSCAAKPALVR